MRLLVAAVLAASSANLPAAAAIISSDTGFGADTATRDTDTGLEWLDLSESFGSLADIEARLQSGGDLEGWRLASQDEVSSFWSNAGVSVTATDGNLVLTMDFTQVAATLTLFDLVGGTSFDGSLDTAFGYTAEEIDAATQAAAFLARRFDGDEGFDATGAVLGASFSKTPGFGDAQAAWLVREFPVPEPAALALLGLGFAGLAGLRNIPRRRRQS